MAKKNADGVTYRVGAVGNTLFAAKRISGLFGADVDVNRLGNLTPDETRAIATKTREILRQLKMAQVATTHWKKQFEIAKKIEKLRNELIDAGLMTAEEIDKILQETMIRTGKHRQHMETIAHATNLELQTITHQGDLDRQTLTQRLELRIKKANELHSVRAKEAVTNNDKGTEVAIAGIRAAASLQAARKQEEVTFQNYIRGDSVERPKELVEGKKPGWFNGWGGWFS